jgi:hypothetical protein
VSAIDTLRDRLNRICVDCLDVPLVYRDGRSALEAQAHEMGHVSGWFADARAALADVEALLEAAKAVWVAHGHVAWCSRNDETPGPCDCHAHELAAAVRRVEGT